MIGNTLGDANLCILVQQVLLAGYEYRRIDVSHVPMIRNETRRNSFAWVKDLELEFKRG